MVFVSATPVEVVQGGSARLARTGHVVVRIVDGWNRLVDVGCVRNVANNQIVERLLHTHGVDTTGVEGCRDVDLGDRSAANGAVNQYTRYFVAGQLVVKYQGSFDDH